MSKINYLIMDVDGTLTDGKIYMSDRGELFKAFNIKDGYGIRVMLPQIGITPVVMTGRNSKIVEQRCAELGVNNIFQGIENKLEHLKRYYPDLSKIAYIGDDNNDLPCMEEIKKAGGVIGCPFDSTDSIKCLADYISPHDGGNGAVRDFISWIIHANV